MLFSLSVHYDSFVQVIFLIQKNLRVLRNSTSRPDLSAASVGLQSATMSHKLPLEPVGASLSQLLDRQMTDQVHFLCSGAKIDSMFYNRKKPICLICNLPQEDSQVPLLEYIPSSYEFAVSLLLGMGTKLCGD